MKLDSNYNDDNFEYGNRGHMNGTMVFILVSLFILLVLSVAVVVGKNTKKPAALPDTTQTVEGDGEASKDKYGLPSTGDLVGNSKLTPEDLDFWDMYAKETVDKDSTDSSKDKDTDAVREKEDPKDKDKDKDKDIDKDKDKSTEDKDAKSEENLDDGKHTKVTLRDGSTEWVAISPYLVTNNFDVTKFVKSNDVMKYVEDGKTRSFFGTDISKYQGTVDFNLLKSNGVDFVMLKVGGRGYGSGVVTLDENFATNLEAASLAGIDIGLYFYSQAITEQEAIDEANIVLASIGEHTIKYPIAFDMEFVDNDTARIEGLTKSEKTAIAKAFMDTIAAAGFRPTLYGNKEWFIKEVDLTKLAGYDIWLSQVADYPDYPYKFSMWQYTTSGKIPGINGYANLNICFLDYSNK